MNPFDLRGPAFLVFYWALVGGCLLLLDWLRKRSDVTGEPTSVSSDPYLLAYLRDGHPEVVRVALLVLIDDGIVLVKDRDLTLAPDPGRPDRRSGRPPIERQLMAFLATRHATVDQIVEAEVGDEACRAYRAELEDLGYLRSRARAELAGAAAIMLALLLALVAVIKIFVALGRGRTNIGFLLISAVVAVVVVAMKAGVPKLAVSSRGELALENVTALLAGAHQQLRSASSTLRGQELAWIAAAYGFSVFNSAPDNFAFWPALAFTARPNYQHPVMVGGAGNTWTSSGSSCGSVSSCGGGGSSCGGGCGGGGCGGCGGG